MFSGTGKRSGPWDKITLISCHLCQIHSMATQPKTGDYVKLGEMSAGSYTI